MTKEVQTTAKQGYHPIDHLTSDDIGEPLKRENWNPDKGQSEENGRDEKKERGEMNSRHNKT